MPTKLLFSITYINNINILKIYKKLVINKKKKKKIRVRTGPLNVRSRILLVETVCKKHSFKNIKAVLGIRAEIITPFLINALVHCLRACSTLSSFLIFLRWMLSVNSTGSVISSGLDTELQRLERSSGEVVQQVGSLSWVENVWVALSLLEDMKWEVVLKFVYQTPDNIVWYCRDCWCLIFCNIREVSRYYLV